MGTQNIVKIRQKLLKKSRIKNLISLKYNWLINLNKSYLKRFYSGSGYKKSSLRLLFQLTVNGNLFRRNAYGIISYQIKETPCVLHDILSLEILLKLSKKSSINRLISGHL